MTASKLLRSTPRVLRKLQIDEVSLVDDGANQLADVLLRKQRARVLDELRAADASHADEVAKAKADTDAKRAAADAELTAIAKALEIKHYGTRSLAQCYAEALASRPDLYIP
jgi:hypothetical protein